MQLTVFVCNDMEEAWIASICAEGEREMAEWERGEDLDHEERLALEAVEDGEVDAWPWYSDAAIEVVEPEVIEDADLCGLAVGSESDDFEDEWTVEQLESDREDT